MNRRVIIGRDIFVDNVTYEDVCDYAKSILEEKVKDRVRFIFAQNPLKIAMASKQPALSHALESASVLIPDGIGIMLGARLAGVRLRERVTGVDLMRRLVALANSEEYRIYFLGAKEGVAEKVANSLEAEYPQLRVVGTANGYFSEEDEEAVVERINNCSPDILFVGIGSPAQELFLYRNRSRMNVPICMGVGGSFDVYADSAKRAPLVFQKLGIEWLYRLFREPKRFRRIVCGISRYLLLLVSNMLIYRTRSRKLPDSKKRNKTS